MNTAMKKYLIYQGFKEDPDKKTLLNVLTSNKKHKSIYIGIDFSKKPKLLLASFREKGIGISEEDLKDGRFVLKKGKGMGMDVFVDVMLDEIGDCMVKNHGKNLFEFRFDVREVMYTLDIKTHWRACSGASAAKHI